jgi:hypothetical protein
MPRISGDQASPINFGDRAAVGDGAYAGWPAGSCPVPSRPLGWGLWAASEAPVLPPYTCSSRTGGKRYHKSHALEKLTHVDDDRDLALTRFP